MLFASTRVTAFGMGGLNGYTNSGVVSMAFENSDE